MDGPRDCHTEWIKSDKDKYGFTYMWNLKNKKGTNELIYKIEVRVMDVESKYIGKLGLIYTH